MVLANFLAGGLLLIIGLINLSGKAPFLIAGYNTMRPEQKAVRNTKTIGRFVGGMLLIGALILLAAGILIQCGIFPTAVLIVSWALFFVMLIAGVIYMNTGSRFKASHESRPSVKTSRVEPKNRSKLIALISGLAVLVLAAGFVVYLVVGSERPPVYTINDTTLKISAQFGESVPLSDITGVGLSSVMPGNLLKTDGAAIGTVLRGTFQSDSGSVKIYVDTSKPPFIYITTKNGLVIINDQTAEKTQALYRELRDKIS